MFKKKFSLSMRQTDPLGDDDTSEWDGVCDEDESSCTGTSSLRRRRPLSREGRRAPTPNRASPNGPRRSPRENPLAPEYHEDALESGSDSFGEEEEEGEEEDEAEEASTQDPDEVREDPGVPPEVRKGRRDKY